MVSVLGLHKSRVNGLIVEYKPWRRIRRLPSFVRVRTCWDSFLSTLVSRRSASR